VAPLIAPAALSPGSADGAVAPRCTPASRVEPNELALPALASAVLEAAVELECATPRALLAPLAAVVSALFFTRRPTRLEVSATPFILGVSAAIDPPIVA
jgi:hypothetical protein